MTKPLFPFIFLMAMIAGCVIPTYTERATLTETRASRSNTKISNVLMVGAGSTASRVFLEDLSALVIKSFAQYNVTCDFNYIGKISRGSRMNLKALVSTKYDAYLVLNPKDTSLADMHKSKAMVFAPLGGGYGASGSIIGNQYKEDYYIELYTVRDSLQRVWQAQLGLDFDFANTKKTEKITKDIFADFLKNNIVSSK